MNKCKTLAEEYVWDDSKEVMRTFNQYLLRNNIDSKPLCLLFADYAYHVIRYCDGSKDVLYIDPKTGAMYNDVDDFPLGFVQNVNGEVFVNIMDEMVKFL